ncbi:MAG TPA: phage tail sheath C-terminal domain-containing protein [Bryobacteraceae bacterium]
MSRVVFDYEGPVVESDPARTDIACFVGLVRTSGAAVPSSIQSWLKTRGWLDGPSARPLAYLADIPIPIDNYATFSLLFDPGGSDAAFGTDYLAAAVRSFFAQGGRRCYVVRMGDPVTPSDDADAKLAKLAKLLPRTDYAVDDRRSWHGVGHLGGLPDVSILALPDLPALSASGAEGAKGNTPAIPSIPEQFVECSASSIVPPRRRLFSQPAPRLVPDDYAAWTGSIGAVVAFLFNRGFHELQFVAAMPLPWDADVAQAAEMASSRELAQDIQEVVQTHLPRTADGDANPFRLLQLSYPWLRTTGSQVLLEGLEPPDGALAGMLAYNALTRGAFTDATKVPPAEIFDIWPPLPAHENTTPLAAPLWDIASDKPLIVRISLFGFTPAGLRLLSDVTAYPGEDYRPARIPRLIAVISRACRRLGEQLVFQNNGPVAWASLQAALRQLMTRLWRLNALEGAGLQDSFSVRCDRSTMTQNDLDNGRLVAQITFTAAATIELIRITLAINTSGGAKTVQLAEAS